MKFEQLLKKNHVRILLKFIQAQRVSLKKLLLYSNLM